MECRICGRNMKTRGHYCYDCGRKKKRKRSNFIAIIQIFSLFLLSFTLFHLFSNRPEKTVIGTTPQVSIEKPEMAEIKREEEEYLDEEHLSGETEEKVPAPKREDISAVSKPPDEITDDVQRDLSALIQDSHQKVYTIYTDQNQGSGFLINEQGDVLTNAHVVEGFFTITAVDSSNQAFVGNVIGYSNETDIAVIRFPALSGQVSLRLDKQNKYGIGVDVLALGSPNRQAGAATLGQISGIERSFYIGERIYENLYQMTAKIGQGSSGGPLLSIQSGEVIGINSARSLEDDSVGFTIPMTDVYPLIERWIASPLSADDVMALFYNEHGKLYYEEEQEDVKEKEWYFDGGEKTDDEKSYYEIPEEWYLEEELTDQETTDNPKEGTGRSADNEETLSLDED
ncbi:S1C family serine protease [Bacillus sp. FJAT-27916]|uniref:S1C family serine protease n=1 Tax=Bacillus sp. FJAT-27916 TaxID=1679169 RepID=UPI0006709E07|nr:S1C family serine protease [Bacillus sp. FJAT-27916]